MPRHGKYPTGIDKPADKYRVRVTWQGHQYAVGMFYTLTDAKTALSIARGQIAAQTFIPPAERRRMLKARAEAERVASVTVRAWSDVWLESLRRAQRSPATLRSYTSALDAHILPALGDLRLADVTPDDVERMLDATPGSATTRNNIAGVTRAMFIAAVNAKAGGLTESPVRVHVSKPSRRKISASDDALPTPEQVKALEAGMPDRLALAVPLAAWCALRLGEVLGLQRRDFIDLDAPDRAVVLVRRQWASKAKPPQYTEPKAGSERTVAVPASLVPMIVEHLSKHVHEAQDAPLFHGADVRRPMSQTAFAKAWGKSREDVMPGLRFHDLRHVGLTRAAQAGATLTELQARGGHRNVETAMRYQHAEAERDRAIAGRLDESIVR